MLTLDYANCLAARVGPHGLPDDIIASNTDRLAELTRSLNQSRGTGWERWRQLWHDPMRSAHLDRVRAVANECEGRFENLIVLGIGGSALGNIAIQSALNEPTYNLMSRADRPGPRVFVVDNVDPANLASVLRVCDPKETLFNVVSKSGETAETAAQFMIVRQLLQDSVGSRWADHVVAITDPERGTMRTICDKAGITTLPVPDGVGGRFSALSPVGLFSAAMAGIDIEDLLDGAKTMDDRCGNEDATKNPAAVLAHLLVQLGTGTPDRQPKPNHVLMPYANALKLMGDWYAQLWAESLGKRFDTDGNEVFAGFTPISALGTTDQHSQVQLYREGPNDKVIGFCEVEDFGADQGMTIPTGMGVEAIGYLEGKRMVDLLNAEKRATEYALVESQRPNYTIKFPRIDAHHIGAFIALWQIATAYAGLMFNIDAYDQPAVETGKKATFGLMGREGFGDWLGKVNETLRETAYTI